MFRRLSVYALVFFGLLVLSGCASSRETTEEELKSGIPSPFGAGVCSSDRECILTDALYDPCGSVHAIHRDTSEATINGYNELQMTITSGQQYDCDLPPKIEDYRAVCREHVCTAVET